MSSPTVWLEVTPAGLQSCTEQLPRGQSLPLATARTPTSPGSMRCTGGWGLHLHIQEPSHCDHHVFNLTFHSPDRNRLPRCAVPRDQICESRASRLSLLLLSTSRLATLHRGMAGQVVEWCLQLSRHKEVGSPHKESLVEALKVFKYSTNWPEDSMWGKLVVTGN